MSKIEWTHRPGTKSEVLNPTTGCDKVSRGCKNCYAEIMHRRLTGMGQEKYQQPFLGHVRYWAEELEKPFRWKKPRTVFLNSMSDIFHKDVTVQQIAEIYAMMFLNPQHTFIVLTKRSNRACDMLNGSEFFDEFYRACNMMHDKYIQTLEQEMYQYVELKSMWPLKNVWQGVSVESQEQDHRIDELANTPAYIRVVSYEPAVGPLDFRKWFNLYEYEEGKYGFRTGSRWLGSPDWIISGGESGRHASPAHPDWFRMVRDQCAAANVPYFFKQWGEYVPVDKKHAMEDNEIVFTNKGMEVIMAEASISQVMAKVGKKESGNLLDGKQHLEFPA